MWRPGFAFVDRRRALLHGRHRAFCIYSVHHRGTPERPGLVLGLRDGGATLGIAYAVEAKAWPDTYAYLLEREQPTETYVERRVQVKLTDGANPGAKVAALCFLSDRNHAQWAGGLKPEAQARLISGARGLSGRNIDYLRDLVDHLREEGARDRGLEALLKAVMAIEGETSP